MCSHLKPSLSRKLRDRPRSAPWAPRTHSSSSCGKELTVYGRTEVKLKTSVQRVCNKSHMSLKQTGFEDHVIESTWTLKTTDQYHPNIQQDEISFVALERKKKKKKYVGSKLTTVDGHALRRSQRCVCVDVVGVRSGTWRAVIYMESKIPAKTSEEGSPI
uniref:Uncharacterized protein n=1 Tax=Knipowitschia caucasica TaxID=637954 RepID=A0AAV2JYJ8_KNICA